MARRLLTLLSALSLLLCVAAVVLWVRSYSSSAFDYLTLRQTYIPAISAGPESVRANTIRRRVKSRRGRLIVVDERLGHAEGFLYFVRTPNVLIDVPWGAVALTTAALPCFRLAVWLGRGRTVRTQPGHCPRCGYDLRATPARCPECGAVPAGKAA